MQAPARSADRSEEIDEAAISTGLTFLGALFCESDLILIRLIETWEENGKKQSRVIRPPARHYTAEPSSLRTALPSVRAASAAERANVFFGVCPRFGDGGRFDLAWQIRIVRALWCDIDNATVAGALARVAKAGLPQPSVVVNSGNGAHLYWLLPEPFLIDDTGDPPPVFTERLSEGNGTKRTRKYIEEPGSKKRLYLDVPANVPRLSPKAIHIQGIVAGIASVIGADHTHDVSRILRIPGTFNRKEQRNGRSPVPCELVSCDRHLKYPLSDFAKFGEASLHKRHRPSNGHLPASEPPIPLGELSALVAACAVAAVGKRSDADWRLVRTAVEKSWPKAEVWQAVAGVGKFAERGEAYFERTWRKAEGHACEGIGRKARKRACQKLGHNVPLVNESRGARGRGRQESNVSGSDPGLVATLAHRICEKEHFAQDEGGKLYRYHLGVYQAKGEAFIKGRVKKLCTKLHRLNEWSSHAANEVVEFIRVDSRQLWPRPPLEVINVRNGLLNAVTQQLGPHTPDHLSPVQLPVVYDPTATCPRIDQFITEVFPDDARTLGYEIPAWLMLPDTPVQKAVLLIGAGGNGKSRYLAMLAAFLGLGNVSNKSLHRLESDRFACARLYGKLANICPDLPSEHLAGTSVFKAITGGDPITGEYKFRDSFDFVPFSRLVFSANNPPRAQDVSDGFFDRWLVVPFDRRFRGEGGEIPAQVLDALLSEPSEQSGLLNRALEALPRLRGAARFTESESVVTAFKEFHAVTDPLAVWLDSHTIEDPGLQTPKRELIAAFNRHCQGTNRPPKSERAFGSALKKLRPHVSDAQRTVDDKVQWCYLGIGLRHDAGPLSSHVSSPDLPEAQDGSRD